MKFLSFTYLLFLCSASTNFFNSAFLFFSCFLWPISIFSCNYERYFRLAVATLAFFSSMLSLLDLAQAIIVCWAESLERYFNKNLVWHRLQGLCFPRLFVGESSKRFFKTDSLPMLLLIILSKYSTQKH